MKKDQINQEVKNAQKVLDKILPGLVRVAAHKDADGNGHVIVGYYDDQEDHILVTSLRSETLILKSEVTSDNKKSSVLFRSLLESAIDGTCYSEIYEVLTEIKNHVKNLNKKLNLLR